MLSVVLQGAVFALFCSVNVKIVRHCKLVQIRFLYFRSIDREVFFRFLTAVLQQQPGYKFSRVQLCACIPRRGCYAVAVVSLCCRCVSRVHMAACPSCRICWLSCVHGCLSFVSYVCCVVPAVLISSDPFFLMLFRICFAGKFSSTGRALYANFHLHEADCVTKTEDETPVNARKPSTSDVSWVSLTVLILLIVVYIIVYFFAIYLSDIVFDICPIYSDIFQFLVRYYFRYCFFRYLSGFCPILFPIFV